MLVSIDKTGNLTVIWNNETANFECTHNTGSIWPGVTGLQKSVTLVNLKKYNDESLEQLEEHFNFHYEFLHKPSKCLIITFTSIS